MTVKRDFMIMCLIGFCLHLLAKQDLSLASRLIELPMNLAGMTTVKVATVGPRCRAH